MKSIKQVLESAYRLYHKPEYLKLDPLQCVHVFRNKQDIEIAGLVAAVLAYGRAEIIIRNVSIVFSKIENKPVDFTLNTTYEDKKKIMGGFKHRFNDGFDLALLFEVIAECIREYGSIEGAYVHDNHNNGKECLDEFTFKLKKMARLIDRKIKSSFDYLLPSPSSGSACKRLNMYLRWMVREDDGIDFGLWKRVSPALLTIPVDTHIARLGREMKFTERKNADWRMAEEITSGLRKYDPLDPVRFDFSLCRVGMLSFRKEAA